MLFEKGGKKKTHWPSVHIIEIIFVEISNSLYIVAVGTVLIISHTAHFIRDSTNRINILSSFLGDIITQM